VNLRRLIYSFSDGPSEHTELQGCPPIWRPGSTAIRAFFSFRDWLWTKTIEPLIHEYDLLGFDVIHLETGLEFYRNGSFVERARESGMTVVNTFHGVELRHRGVIEAIDQHVQLNLTSELDLLPRHPNIKYLHLPFDMDLFTPDFHISNPVIVCHATRNRHFKGSDAIIEICTKLEKQGKIKFSLIENLPHSESIRLKQNADIYIDQIANVAPGYGMNSIEAVAMGAVSCTYMDEDYQKFLPDHPFVHVSSDNLEQELLRLASDKDKLISMKQSSLQWMQKTHSLNAVGNQLYQYYQLLGVKE